jgi:ribA/ribD-fused uncharacterized protein
MAKTDFTNDDVIRFYRERDKPYGCFSNFSPHGFELDGVHFRTVEHFFQASKFSGTPHFDLVRLAKSPMDAKTLGNSRDVAIRSDWDAIKDEVMLQGLRQKFETHPDIRTILIETGAAYLIEDAPADYYWGCGADGSGKNMLGRLLAKVRDEIGRSRR